MIVSAIPLVIANRDMKFADRVEVDLGRFPDFQIGFSGFTGVFGARNWLNHVHFKISSFMERSGLRSRYLPAPVTA